MGRHPLSANVFMNIWLNDSWKSNLNDTSFRRKGIRFRYERNVPPEVKQAVAHFAQWLRSEYVFPIRVPVYVKGEKTIRAKDGDQVVGTFFEPFSYEDEPYIRIATGDYDDLVIKYGKDNALAAILTALAHEITHYFQWINNIQITDAGRERQAAKCAKQVLEAYAETRDHP